MEKQKLWEFLEELWDLLHNLEAIVDKSHADAIRKVKPKLESLMWKVDQDEIIL